MKINLDKLGMSCSTLCFWHCILFPFLFVMFPMITLFHSSLFEWSFLSISLIIACFALGQGFLLHKHFKPAAFAFSGFAVFIWSRWYIQSHTINIFFARMQQNYYEGLLLAHLAPIASLLAGVLIFTSHYINHKHIKSCSCGNH